MHILKLAEETKIGSKTGTNGTTKIIRMELQLETELAGTGKNDAKELEAQKAKILKRVADLLSTEFDNIEFDVRSKVTLKKPATPPLAVPVTPTDAPPTPVEGNGEKVETVS